LWTIVPNKALSLSLSNLFLLLQPRPASTLFIAFALTNLPPPSSLLLVLLTTVSEQAWEGRRRRRRFLLTTVSELFLLTTVSEQALLNGWFAWNGGWVGCKR
jgi:hypothetical protein